MKHISELREILSNFFDWHKCRLDCLGQIIHALFIVRTINLTQVTSAFNSQVKVESSYRRVCRFFTGFSFDMSKIVLLVFRMFPLGERCTLILDRTNWKWGQTPINILMLSIAYRGIGIPLFWVVLNLEGNSCAEDRIDLLKRVVERLGTSRIEALLADTHITDPDKIEKVVFVLAIAFCWAYRMGDIQDQIRAIEVKTHGRKARSLFREGLNLIRRAIFERWSLRKFRRLLSCFTCLEPAGCVL